MSEIDEPSPSSFSISANSSLTCSGVSLLIHMPATAKINAIIGQANGNIV